MEESSLCDPEPFLGRNMCHANIVKFREAMSTFDWREILSMSDAKSHIHPFMEYYLRNITIAFLYVKSVNNILIISLGLQMP